MKHHYEACHTHSAFWLNHKLWTSSTSPETGSLKFIRLRFRKLIGGVEVQDSMQSAHTTLRSDSYRGA